MNHSYKIQIIIGLFICSLLCFNFCRKKATAPIVSTNEISEITQTTAAAGGKIISDGSAEITSRGVCWETSANPTLSNSITTDSSDSGSFTSSITGLTAGVTYHIRAYAINSAGTAYGPDVSFTTIGGSGHTILTLTGQTYTSTDPAWAGVQPSQTTVTDLTFSDSSITCVNSGAHMLSAGGESTSANDNHFDGAILKGNKVTWNGSGTLDAEGFLVGFDKNQLIEYNYFDKTPYAIVFKAEENMTSTSGGFMYNIVKNPSIGVRIKGMNGVNVLNNTFFDNASNSNAFIYISGNSSGGSNGTKIKNNIFYTTTGKAPIYITSAADIVNFDCDYNAYYDATGAYRFYYEGSSKTFAEWQALGYDTHSVIVNPNFLDIINFVPASRLNYGTNLGSIYQVGLSTSALWTVGSDPALANQDVNWQVGAAVYGTILTATTPTVTTTSISNITTTTATGGGNITADGGASVMAKGVCWNTSTNPTISNSKTTDSSALGSFTSAITGLTSGTVYHVRAYAINSIGTAYGSEVLFTTATPNATIPIVATASISGITQTTASCGGDISSDGGASVTVRGVCWNTSMNPNITNSHTSDGIGKGAFTSSITGLVASAVYHVRSYATNSVGTAYGSDVQFTTNSSGNTILTIENQAYTNSVTGNWSGVNISRTKRTDFTFRNNSVTSVNSGGYMIQAGDEARGINNNNLDGEVITGNNFTWNGTDIASTITHGVFVGYNKNSLIKYNYLFRIPTGMVIKSNGMTYTSGGVAYNIINKTGDIGIAVKGMNNVPIYNNTFYSNEVPFTSNSKPGTSYGLVDIFANDGLTPWVYPTGTKIKNNIFYTVNKIYNITIENSQDLAGFESDYNLFWCESGTPMFNYLGVSKTFAQWQALGYDTHSIVVNPNFNNFTNFVPVSRLNYGINLGTVWQTGLSTTAAWILGNTPTTSDQNGTWQVGARVY